MKDFWDYGSIGFALGGILSGAACFLAVGCWLQPLGGDCLTFMAAIPWGIGGAISGGVCGFIIGGAFYCFKKRRKNSSGGLNEITEERTSKNGNGNSVDDKSSL